DTQGHWVGRYWLNVSTGAVYIAASVDTGAADWTLLNGSINITGLSSPLNAPLDADGKAISNAPFAGFRDYYYDLDDDPENLVDTGVASLSAEYNANQYAGLDDALEIVLPDPSSVGTGEAPFGVISVSLASGGSIEISDSESWAWEKASP